MRRRLRHPALRGALGIALAVAVTGCSGGTGAATAGTATGVVVPSTNPFVSSTPTPTMPPPVDVGQATTNGDLTLTVTSARVVATEPMRQAGPTLGTASGPFVPRLPPAGTKFIELRTHLVNGGRDGIDVVCEVVLSMELVDDHGILFDNGHVEEPDVLPGNPPCSVDLPPGGQEDVTWLYYVPVGAHIVAWRWGDFRSWSGRRAPATVRVDL